MDPKLSGLDPKLREAYERVMSGPTTPPPSGATPQPNPGVPPTHNPANPVVPNPVVPPPPPIMPSQTPVPPPQASQPAAPSTSTPIGSTVAFNAHNSSLNKGTADSKKSGGMKIMLIVCGAILFLIFYTFIWVYLFNLKLPFIG